MTFEPLETLGTHPNAWLVDENTADITRAPLPQRAIALPTATKTLKLDLSKAALLVVDMQNDFCHPDGWLAQIGVDYYTGSKCDRIFCDQGESGAKGSRPEWDNCLDHLRKGDTLVIWKLDRASHSTKHLIELAEELK